MYVSTSYPVGKTVYVVEDCGRTVRRFKIDSIVVTFNNDGGSNVKYFDEFSNSFDDDYLRDSAQSAFWNWDAKKDAEEEAAEAMLKAKLAPPPEVVEIPVNLLESV